MSMQKLPTLGTFFKPFVPIAGQASTAVEVSIARFKLSGAAITLDGTTATVTLASHLNTVVGQQVTFSGATGVTAINNQTWTISSIPTTGTYTFPCSLTGTVGGTIVQEPVFTMPQGFSYALVNANANIEYCSDNSYIATNGSQTSPTWKIYVTGNATPVPALVASDGFSVRLRCNGTTATTYFSVVN